MEIRKTRVSNTQNLCLCRMASDTAFVSEVGLQISNDVWEDDWARILADWIVQYTMHYSDKAMPVLPRMARDRADSIPDEDTAAALCRFATHLEEFYEENKVLFENSKFLDDSILRWIKERNLKVLRDRLDNALEDGALDQAEEALHKYSEVKQVEITATDILHDAGKIVDAYEEDRGELLQLPGAFGELTGPLARGDVMLILGESGTGKSWVSLQIGREAMRKGLSVLYINLENADRQMVRRIYSSMSGCAREHKTVYMPYFEPVERDYRSDDDSEGRVVKWKVSYRQKELNPPELDRERVSKFLKNRRLEANGGQFLLESYSPKTLTVRGLVQELDNLRDYRHFIPDVLIVDYGDLMRPENPREDKRTQVDSIYLGLRSIALERDMLLISPVQSNRAGYGRDVGKANVAENIANVNHASMILGLNHTAVEKDKGITRIKMLKNRDGHEAAEPVVALGSLDIGRPVMSSRWMHELNYGMGGDDDD